MRDFALPFLDSIGKINHSSLRSILRTEVAIDLAGKLGRSGKRATVPDCFILSSLRVSENKYLSVCKKKVVLKYMPL